MPVIDILSPSELDKVRLHALFASNLAVQQFFPNKNYKIPLAQEGVEQVTNIRLSHGLLRLPFTHDTTLEFLILDNEILATGTFGEVISLKGSIKATKTTLRYQVQFTPLKTPRIIKKQPYRFVGQRESMINMHVPHLEASHAIVVGTDIYQSMRYFEGNELLDILVLDESHESPLSLTQRIELSHAIIFAYQTQVQDATLIHKDVKPENIIVNLSNPISVHFIDFAFGVKFHGGPREVITCGTHGYIAKEVYDGELASTATDIYALGKILALIWGAKYSEAIPEDDAPAYYPMSFELFNTTSTQGHIPKTLEKTITSLIANMLQPRPTKRPTVIEIQNTLRPLTYQFGAHHQKRLHLPLLDALIEQSLIDYRNAQTTFACTRRIPSPLPKQHKTHDTPKAFIQAIVTHLWHKQYQHQDTLKPSDFICILLVRASKMHCLYLLDDCLNFTHTNVQALSQSTSLWGFFCDKDGAHARMMLYDALKEQYEQKDTLCHARN